MLVVGVVIRRPVTVERPRAHRRQTPPGQRCHGQDRRRPIAAASPTGHHETATLAVVVRGAAAQSKVRLAVELGARPLVRRGLTRKRC